MMRVTKHEVKSTLRGNPVTVPEGVRCRMDPIEGPSENGEQHWVDQLDWLSSFDRHDATYYGIRVHVSDTILT